MTKPKPIEIDLRRDLPHDFEGMGDALFALSATLREMGLFTHERGKETEFTRRYEKVVEEWIRLAGNSGAAS